MLSNLIFLSAFLITSALIIACAALAKLIRKRSSRRSPLQGKKIANLPGQQLMARISDHGDDMIAAFMVMYLSLPMMLFAWAIGRVDWTRFKFGVVEAMFLAAGLAIFAFGLWSYVRNLRAYLRAKEGQLAEQVTGQLLNRLVGPRCVVAHDVPCEGFNIDHVVIAPRCVYAVETKSFRKPRNSDDDSHYKVAFDGAALRFPDFVDTKAVEQARRQAQWLARYLKESLGQEVPVVPAVALPGWWIERTDAARRSDVRVFTPMGRGAEFLLDGEENLVPAMRSLVAQAVSQKYPSVD
ncbi:nuclease-related domain-containing protein [Pseudoxanthomonas kaohsiungensis]|uniref:Nuclease-related domain-containing protein n=1 Tax=Pseudoxanthomonas kaohsiungensis TaxID=283923 RepID=A0ABW3M1I2_9GAMM|nr:nuclease-related domain-containing protein [Pseudoxanthomonas kaohsiungensis]KAF1705004.1 hypothetical protein CSC66_00220 [Pseudoxanthomonas kaohsiungensis]